ncbi:hypothetical protein [Teredinibacter sp. KSP-S5-2]|uniref:hypothetical protein n=1 Tax=Teredinibacter sp. KSP-S5-2 TaxID=3034506 RepID=UPI0029347907|nr:hypothetical protein [Teredinibacter sp. KSP-S5-2]WNO07832.1 hypothetical protein P5V12_12615 [Teredinibacter sp. KSP-S5-2]
MKESGFLYDGDHWEEHRGFLVGDEVGLRKLRDAIDIALVNGESEIENVSKYIGVKNMHSKYFDSKVRYDEIDIEINSAVSFRWVILFISLLTAALFSTKFF